MPPLHRRHFLQSSLSAATFGAWSDTFNQVMCHAAIDDSNSKVKMRFGLVTYMWGFDWDLPTLLKNCETANVFGVELRTEHAHGVEPKLDDAARRDVRERFSNSPITVVGMGCNQDFHHPDPEVLRKSIERAKEFIKLSHDIGGSGTKVKPNDLPVKVPHEQTIDQIGRALNELGTYAADYGQQVRLEVHGQCAPLPIIAAIMEVADHPNVAVCWNSNLQDLDGEGLEHNFRLVEKRLGATTHVRHLDDAKYPFPKLIALLKGIDYNGWVLLEAGDKPPDRVAALAAQQAIFDKLTQ